MRIILLILVILFFSCKSNNDKEKQNSSSNKTAIIEYLKRDFHVIVDTSKIDSFYKKDLIERKQSLEVDSLISSRLFITAYKPLNLSFIRFSNYFGIRDTTGENRFDVYIIEDNTTQKFYVDYTNNEAGMIIEPLCMHSSISTHIKTSNSNVDISKENIDAINSINSSRLYGENECRAYPEKTGIQSYLNNVFHFKMLDRIKIDSLFLSYDKDFYNRRDTLLLATKDLYDYLRVQALRIGKEPDYGSKDKSLIYLKDQISLLLLQNTWAKNEKQYFWIYKNNYNLRVRRLLITGNKISGFSYFIKEYELCF